MNRALKTLRIIWLAFLMMPLVLGVVLVVTPIGANPTEPMIPLTISFMAVLEIPVLFFMRFKFLGSLALREPEDLRVDGMVEGEDLADAIQSAATRYNSASIVSFAFAEAIVLFGFVSSFLSGSLIWFGGLAAVSIVLFLLFRPTLGGAMCALTLEERHGLRQAMKEGL